MRNIAVLAALALAACSPDRPPDIQLSNAWARPAAPGKPATAAYLTIVNTGGPDRLVAVATPVGEASLHSTSMDGGIMRMRPVAALDIANGAVVRLKPGGHHIMITGLEQPLTNGGSVPLVLRFEKSGERQVRAAVRAAAPGGEN